MLFRLAGGHEGCKVWNDCEQNFKSRLASGCLCVRCVVVEAQTSEQKEREKKREVVKVCKE